jgi:hypothetical protein
MKESVAGPIGEFDEAKSLLGVEPLDHPMERRAGRCLEPGLAEPRSGAESARLWVVSIGVEVATPRITEILMSHFGSWRSGVERVR